MKVNERQEDILKRLSRQGSVLVKELAHVYRVTEDLIRKDLKKLEDQGLLDRVYGGAERKTNKFEASGIHYRMQLDSPEKKSIAQGAMSLIQKGDYIFLDTSSTSAHIAMALATSGLELTVITDMLAIMNLLCDIEGITLIGIGGQYNPYTGGFTGQEALRQIAQYTVDKAFISCRSVSLEDGFLIEGFMEIGNTKRAILDIGRHKIVATQALKYRSSGLYRFYAISDLDAVITDKPLSDKQRDQLMALDISVYCGS